MWSDSAVQATPLWDDLMVQGAGVRISPDRQHPPLQGGLDDLLNLVQSTWQEVGSRMVVWWGVDVWGGVERGRGWYVVIEWEEMGGRS